MIFFIDYGELKISRLREHAIKTAEKNLDLIACSLGGELQISGDVYYLSMNNRHSLYL